MDPQHPFFRAPHSSEKFLFQVLNFKLRIIFPKAELSTGKSNCQGNEWFAVPFCRAQFFTSQKSSACILHGAEYDSSTGDKKSPKQREKILLSQSQGKNPS